MWKLIKADIQYNKTIFAILYSIIIPLTAANAIWGGLDEIILKTMFFSIAAMGAFIGNEETKYRFCRRRASLPVSLRHLSPFCIPPRSSSR